MTTKGGQPFDISLTEGYNPIRFPAINNQTCFNLFDFEGNMIPTSGYYQILSTLYLKKGESRGIFFSDVLKKCIVVLLNVVYAVTDKDHSILGTMDSFSGKVYIEENGLSTLPTDNGPGGQIAISDGSNIYVYTLNGEFSKAKDEEGNLLTFLPGTLAFESSFFFCNDLNSNQIHISNINNARVWNSTGYSTISEKTISCLAFKNLLFVFGKDKSFLFYSNAQNEFFPYSQDTSRAWEYGCLAQGSLSSALGLMAWVGNTRYGNPTILFSTGGEPESISTPGIDSIINTFSNLSDAEGFIFQEDGHTFYQLTFYQDNFSLLYDFKSKKWTRLTDYTGENYNNIRQVAYYEGKNKLFAITKDSSSINIFGNSIYTQDGKIVPRMILTNNYTQDERPYGIQEIDLEIEQGENQNTSKISIGISKDRGRTFPINRMYTLGPIGERRRVLRWRKLGYARWWTLKFEFFSEDRFVILKCTGFIQA